MAIKETVKKIFEKVLSMGTPPEKEVLYKEVVKRKTPKKSSEAMVLDDIKNSIKKIWTPEEEIEFSRGTPNTPVKKEAKKTTTKTTPTQKSTTSNSTKKKTTTATKKSTAQTTKMETNATAKKAPAKKTATKKTTAQKPTEKKTTRTTKKATFSTKKPATKKPTATTKSTTTKKSPAKSTVAKKVADKKATTKKVASETKETAKKKTTASKKTVSTTKSATRTKGSKRDAKIALYIKDIKKHYGEVDEAFVAIIVKNLGPSIYRKDAELVSCSDPKELDTVRRNFLTKKLGIDASKAVLDAAIQDVCTELKGVRTKYRATFYYSLAKKFKKESVLS